MLPLYFSEITTALGSPCSLEGQFNGVCTDTRKIVKDSLFIALIGENFDGHSFVNTALENGAKCVVVSRDCSLGNKQIIVKNTRQALLDLAGYYRSLFDIPVVGVTGSVGKTTTKEMIHTVMSSKYKTLKNEGNLNNEIGVPLTLFNLDKSYEAAVIEMGMNNFGEISRITAAAKPTCAVISNIGVSHIENLGSREGILKAKLEILEGMNDTAPLFLNGDDDMLSKAETGNHPVTYYGLNAKYCAYNAQAITSSLDETEFACGFIGGTVKACLPFTGRHNIYNSLAALAVGNYHGISIEQGLEALKGYKTTGLRQKIVKNHSITFIEDCYNASPDSQAAAMSVLGETDCKRKIAVVGDMLELGDYSEKAHRLVGKYAFDNGVDILVTCGERAKWSAEEAEKLGVKEIYSFTNHEDVTDFLANTVKEDDCILFKASRAMKLEEIIYALYDRLEKQFT